MSRVNAGHFVLGTGGLALLRRWLIADADELRRRVEEISRLAGAPDQGPLAIRFDADELDVKAGYARWSATYDAAPNPLIRVEEPVVRAMIDAAAAGDALDAACGTGRHAAYMAARGHRVTGVDATPEMLEKARERVPDADLREGDLESLPIDDASAELAVCGLALSHLAQITPAVAELARVLRPGGRLIISDLHPTMMVLGATALFLEGDGSAGNVRSFHHSHGEYLAAFQDVGLRVLRCAEPALEEQDLLALSGGLVRIVEDAFRSAWVGLPQAIVWELTR